MLRLGLAMTDLNVIANAVKQSLNRTLIVDNIITIIFV